MKLSLPAKQSAEKIIFGVFWQFPSRTLPLNRINKIVEFFKAPDIKLSLLRGADNESEGIWLQW